ncbi:hypothetical protein ACHAXH_001036 [Discostella pseudostelligera]
MSASQTTKASCRPKNRVSYDVPTETPQESLHWKRLFNINHININNSLIHTHEELIEAFQKDVISIKGSEINCCNSSSNNKSIHRLLAEWSCIIGYCEALSTHKDPSRRFTIFPIPLKALRRLVEEDFVSLLHRAQTELSTVQLNGKKPSSTNSTSATIAESTHRQTVRSVANAIWKRAQNKKGSMQDELHANSLYSCLCGDIDGKSLDCFGAALLTVIGMNILGFEKSCLTLSEDHAYESHHLDDDKEDANNHYGGNETTRKLSTCEVAIPGNTLAVQSKRGQDISHTFAQLKHDHITAETSWLYMAKNAVRCDTPCMVMAALLSNLNCDIDKQKPSGATSDEKPHLVSRALYKLKRDMLWILHDDMTTFPFALMELGECEEHLSSPRGMEWVDVSGMLNSTEEILVLRNEKLFLDAIQVSRSMYDDAQVYPYIYCGHYHRDAGRDGEEYRLVESLRLYAEATRVACTYRYDSKDCLQLMKHFTTVASLISKDILIASRQGGNEKTTARCWHDENAIAAATWLIGFFDSLLLWEEKEHKLFVEVHNIQHKHFMGKLFQQFPLDIRTAVFDKMHSHECLGGDEALAVTEKQMLYFRNPRSRRLAKGSLLVAALSKEKIVVREMDMALLSNEEGRSTRQVKRKSSG